MKIKNIKQNIDFKKKKFIKYLNRNNLFYTTSDVFINKPNKFFINKRKQAFKRLTITSLITASALYFYSAYNDHKNYISPTEQEILEDTLLIEEYEHSPLFEKEIKNNIYYKDKIINKKDYNQFIKLLKKTEGLSTKFYLDNIGIAIGYGWNPTRNSVDFNQKFLNFINLTNSEKEIILSISNNKDINYIPLGLENVNLSATEIKKSAIFMYDFYEKEFLKVLVLKAKNRNIKSSSIKNKYFSMPTHQKSVLIHMAYKLGYSNLYNYNNFFNSLINYMYEPNKENINQVANNINYRYKNKDGNYISDLKTTKIHHKTFLNHSTL